MANRSITIDARGLKPLTVHELRVGDTLISAEDVQISGSRRGEGTITSDERGQVRLTLFMDTNDGVSKRVVTLTAPFSKAAAELTF